MTMKILERNSVWVKENLRMKTGDIIVTWTIVYDAKRQLTTARLADIHKWVSVVKAAKITVFIPEKKYIPTEWFSSYFSHSIMLSHRLHSFDCWFIEIYCTKWETWSLLKCGILREWWEDIVFLDMKGCICHFITWRIHPFIYKGDYIVTDAIL